MTEPAQKSGISHDTAARLLGIAPGELSDFVRDGYIRRHDRNSYSVPVLVQDYVGHLKTERERADAAPKQAEIAAHLDLSDRSVREFITRYNIDHKASTLTELRIAYIRHLREMAAGRATDGTIDLPTERALLARAQREGQEIKNEVARGSYAPIEVLTDVLANASQSVVDQLDQIPAGIARVCPDLPQSVRDLLMTTLARARNEMVRKTASLVADALEPTDVQEEETPEILEDAAE